MPSRRPKLSFPRALETTRRGQHWYAQLDGHEVRLSNLDKIYWPGDGYTKGDLLAYVSGPGTWYRKGYRGSSNDDVWICDSRGENHKPITRFNGQDSSPMWSADGRSLYMVTESFGTPANVVRQEIDPTGALVGSPYQLTFHKDEGVRRMGTRRHDVAGYHGLEFGHDATGTGRAAVVNRVPAVPTCSTSPHLRNPRPHPFGRYVDRDRMRRNEDGLGNERVGGKRTALLESRGKAGRGHHSPWKEHLLCPSAGP